MIKQIKNLPIHQFSKRLWTRCTHHPKLLKASHVLVRGDDSALKERVETPTVAIVGTRRPTEYGKNFVKDFLAHLAIQRPNTNIISGGAFGIDTEAHVGALKLGLSTQAWVVGPILNPNPRSQGKVFEKLEQTRGCAVLCVDSLEPDCIGRAPLPNDWLSRNAWIAAAADVLIVVEATLRSGTQSTVDHALNIGIPIYILPGDIDSPQSQGANLMISMGCGHMIESIEILTKRLLVDLELASYNKDMGVVSGDVLYGA